MQWCGDFPTVLILFLLSIVIFANHGLAEGQYEDNRCICVCPDPPFVSENTTRPARKEYINPRVPSNQCTCDAVVLPKLSKGIPTGKEGEFCSRCDCKHESRNTTIIKVVVIIVIWIVSLLMIYMLFLMCLDPLLNKRVKNTAYTEHTNEDDESVGGGRTSHPLRMTNTEGPPANVLNRVGHHQSKWKRQVQEQRKNIYDRHTMLN